MAFCTANHEKSFKKEKYSCHAISPKKFAAFCSLFGLVTLQLQGLLLHIKNTGRHFTRGFIFGFHFLRASEIVIYFSFAGPEFTI